MTVVTDKAAAYVATLLYNMHNSIYIGIGKSSPWENDSKPDPEDSSKTNIDEPLFYVKADKVQLCRTKLPTEAPTAETISYGSNQYVPVSVSDAISSGAEYIYCSAVLSSENVGKITFREAGLFSGLQLKQGVTKTTVQYSDIASIGLMLSLVNQSPVSITDTASARVSFLYHIKPATV